MEIGGKQNASAQHLMENPEVALGLLLDAEGSTRLGIADLISEPILPSGPPELLNLHPVVDEMEPRHLMVDICVPVGSDEVNVLLGHSVLLALQPLPPTLRRSL